MLKSNMLLVYARRRISELCEFELGLRTLAEMDWCLSSDFIVIDASLSVSGKTRECSPFLRYVGIRRACDYFDIEGNLAKPILLTGTENPCA